MITEVEAIEQLGQDMIEENPYELFRAVHATAETFSPCPRFVGDDHLSREVYEEHLDNFAMWLASYRSLNSGDRIGVSDIVITTTNKHHCHGVVFVSNGMNGSTQVSRQSLRHIVDIVSHLEDFYGARAYISSVFMRNDVFYYTISFVIWKDRIDGSSNNFGNLRPLYHE